MRPEEIQSKYRIMVERLYDRTISDSINWEMGWNGDVQCQFGAYTVHLKSSRDSDGEPYEHVELRNSNDIVIDSFSDAYITGETPRIANFTTYYGLMAELRQSARRKAMGVGDAIDTILGNLPPAEE